MQETVREGELAEMRYMGVETGTSTTAFARAGSSEAETPIPGVPEINTLSELAPGLYPDTLTTIQKAVAAYEEAKRAPSAAPSAAPVAAPVAAPAQRVTQEAGAVLEAEVALNPVEGRVLRGRQVHAPAARPVHRLLIIFKNKKARDFL